MEIYGFLEKDMPRDKPLPPTAHNGAPLDGINGTSSKPFLTAKDKNGNQFQFAVAWKGKLIIQKFTELCTQRSSE
ncbi:MAG: hypothetical protein MUE64_07525 [Ignavibacteriaceae bacterium]|nr:hypothetical protein [Ignavibacteriaceae bacterium]